MQDGKKFDGSRTQFAPNQVIKGNNNCRSQNEEVIPTVLSSVYYYAVTVYLFIQIVLILLLLLFIIVLIDPGWTEAMQVYRVLLCR